MAWPSSADIDTTKLDNDNDSIKESRAELYKMAGYVNDIIDTGPSGGGGSTITGLFTVQDIDSAGDVANIQIDARDTDFSLNGTIICEDGKSLTIATRTSSIIKSRINLSSDGTFVGLQPETGGQVIFNAGITKHVGITTTARNALTPEAGMMIFNTTDSKFQGYNGTTWVDLH